MSRETVEVLVSTECKVVQAIVTFSCTVVITRPCLTHMQCGSDAAILRLYFVLILLNASSCGQTLVAIVWRYIRRNVCDDSGLVFRVS